MLPDHPDMCDMLPDHPDMLDMCDHPDMCAHAGVRGLDAHQNHLLLRRKGELEGEGVSQGVGNLVREKVIKLVKEKVRRKFSYSYQSSPAEGHI